MMENRSIKRRPLFYYLRVFDRDTDMAVGRLVDISIQGLQLMGERPIENGTVIPLRIVLPMERKGRKYLDFDAVSIWCNEERMADFFTTGFEFKALSSEGEEIIKGLIRDSGFKDDYTRLSPAGP